MIFMGDYNVEPNEATMFDFGQVYSMNNLIRDYCCQKNLENPSCIELVLTDKPKSFLRSAVIETGLSDFHEMALAITKAHFKAQSKWQTLQITVILKSSQMIYSEEISEKAYDLKIKFRTIKFTQSCAIFLIGKHFLRKDIFELLS